MQRRSPWVLVAAAFIGLVLVAPLLAYAAAPSISGRVTDAGGAPLAGMKVQFWRWDGISWQTYGTARTTDSNGDYTYGSLIFLTYKIEFYDPAGGYVREFYNGKPTLGDADTITLGPAEDRTGIDASLEAAASIAGVVSDSSGLPVPGITVNAYRNRGGSTYDTTVTASAVTQANGSYSVGGLPAGSYGLQYFSGVYAPHYRSAVETSGVTALVRATPVDVNAGQSVTGVNETMLKYGTIAGIVDSITGPVANATVNSYRYEAGVWVDQVVGLTSSGPGGDFTATPLYPGRYRVKFTAPAVYPAQYHRSALAIGSGIDVVVHDNGTTQLDTWLVAADSTPPTSTLAGVPDGWVKDPFTASIDSTDTPAGSGVVAVYYQWGVGAPALYGGPFAVTEEGSRTLSYWAVDGFGNTETAKSAAVRLDSSAPTSTANIDADWHTTTVTVTLGATDAHSGVLETWHKIGASAPATLPASFDIGEGQTVVEYWSVDNAGNVEATQTGTVMVDVTPPTVSSNATTTPYMNSATIDISASDALSGLAQVVYRLDGVTETSGTTVPLGPGTYSLDFRARDVAGNWSEWSTPVAITVVARPLVTVHRFYNSRTGVHFYTASESEKAQVLATLGAVFSYEGPAYQGYGGPGGGAIPVHRFYNRQKGVHFYTASDAEKTQVMATLGWLFAYEGVAFYVAGAPDSGTQAVYRFYNRQKGVHFYTSSESEKTQVIGTLGWLYAFEGVGFNVPR